MDTHEKVATALARGRVDRNLRDIALVTSIVTMLCVLMFCWVVNSIKQKVIVLDLASGDLIQCPIVDPSDSKNIVDTMSIWAAKCIVDREPGGLENQEFINVLFDPKTAADLRGEFDKVKIEYAKKELRTHAEVEDVNAQPIGKGVIRAKVKLQVFLTGVLDGRPIQDPQERSLNIDMVRNPRLGMNTRYPLMVTHYEWANPVVAKK